MRSCTPDLILQPGNGSRLTRITDAVRLRGQLVVYALCNCGTIVNTLRARWIDGGQRPLMCAACNRKKANRTFRVAPRGTAPYAERGR